MLHEKPDYFGVSGWLGEKYSNLPHQSVEGQNLEISPEDFIIIPEIFGYIMSQLTNLPCTKIVLSQAYDHIFETLQPGQVWSQFGFTKCITTSENQKKYISDIMRNFSIDILEPVVSPVFTTSKFPSKPIIAVSSREQREAINLIKTFYQKYPQFRWVTFRDMRGISEEEFANTLKDCMLSVWIDKTSSFGTFPLESMKSNVPVLGVLPKMVPSWLNEENGIWINNQNMLVDVIADFIQNWLEDNINPKLYEEMEMTINKLSTQEKFESEVVELFTKMIDTRADSFESQLSKLQITE
jgi:hypothetical protein